MSQQETRVLIIITPLPLKGNSGSKQKVRSPCDDVLLSVTRIMLCCLMSSTTNNSFFCVLIRSVLVKQEDAAQTAQQQKQSEEQKDSEEAITLDIT